MLPFYIVQQVNQIMAFRKRKDRWQTRLSWKLSYLIPQSLRNFNHQPTTNLLGSLSCLSWRKEKFICIFVREEKVEMQKMSVFWPSLLNYHIMIDFNSISTPQGLFYTKRLGNHVHCMFIFVFFVQLFLKRFFEHHSIEYKWFLKRSIWSKDRTLTGTTTMCQSGSASNGNKGVLLTSQISRTGSLQLDAV